jgi:hypothetical protein
MQGSQVIQNRNLWFCSRIDEQTGVPEGHNISRGKMLPTIRGRILSPSVGPSSPERVQFLRNVGSYLVADTT